MARRGVEAVRKRPGWAVAAVAVLTYGLLYHGYWWPGNDSELYLSIARSLVKGEGFTFSGHPVQKVPPGWPLVLAGMLTVTDRFAILNLLPLVCMTGAAVLWFGTLRRLMSPATAAMATTVAVVLYPAVRLSYSMHSDALFCLVLAAAAWLAVRLDDRWRRAGGMIAALVVLSLSLVLLRWAAVVVAPVLVGLLLTGERRVRWSPAWLAAGLCVVAIAGGFVMGRQLVAVDGPLSPTDRGEAAAGGGEVSSVAVNSVDEKVAESWTLLVDLEQGVWNLLWGGRWLSWYLWQPAELSGVSLASALAVNVVGLVLLGVLAVGAWRDARGSRQWAVTGVWIVVGLLAYRWWPTPNPRYLVPVGPLLVAGVLRGLWAVGQWGPVHWRLGRRLSVVFVAGTLACNVGLWCCELAVARSGDFLGAFRAGQMRELVSISQWIQQHASADEVIATNYYSTNLGRVRRNTLGHRALHLLSDRRILVPRDEVISPSGKPQDGLIDWMRQWDVRLVVCRLEPQPWRLHHQRVPWLQRWLTGESPTEAGPYFVLYELVDNSLKQITLTPTAGGVVRIPGVETADDAVNDRAGTGGVEAMATVDRPVASDPGGLVREPGAGVEFSTD